MSDQPNPPFSTVTRRALLGISAGLAGAAALSPLVSEVAAATPVGGAAPLAGAPEILTDDIFPIGLFWPPPQRQTRIERYDEIAESGINLVMGGNDLVNKTANHAMLPVAHDAGLRVLPVEDRINQVVPKTGFEADLRSVLEEYERFPAFKGFRIADEPSPIHYPRFRMITDVLAAASPDKLAHINLVPIYSANLDATYQEFLRRYVEQVDLPFISFDHYPLLTDDSVRATFFLNHRRIREAGLASQRPTWVYVCSVDHWNLKRPNYAELAWQITMGLVYGCKGIQYFTYWTPENRPDFEFGEALIKKDGCQSQVYVDAKAINNGYLQPVGRQLKQLVSERVFFHVGTGNPPLGGDRFDSAQSAVLEALAGSPVVVGEFRRQPAGSERWILVANRSYSANASTTVTVKSGVREVAVFDPATGQYAAVPVTNRQFAVAIDRGLGKLYRITTS
ncbi:hypothetical protein [Microlunatus speluncae]|uniref:hypothetical protein n=1 Tax=Microlunatus speluncae TaxID=2594267 RepID=UPI0012665387|nr:hypothetical protein [Microlunatus speluncae]